MHHILSIAISYFFTHICLFSSAQAVATGGWVLFLNTYKINNSLTGYFDGQLRSNDQLKNIQTIILRPGLQYNLNKNVNVSLGYAFIGNRRTVAAISGYLPEHRVWEQLQVKHPFGFTILNHRFRLEQRFIPKATITNNSLSKDGTSYANRFRYFVRSIIPISGARNFKKGAFVALQNEVFINIGDKSTVNGKHFDQNRAYIAIGYRIGPQLDIETGYLNQYISGQNKSFINNHNIQIASYIRL